MNSNKSLLNRFKEKIIFKRSGRGDSHLSETEDVQEFILKSRMDALCGILKEKGEYDSFYGLLLRVYFLVNKLGLGISLAKIRIALVSLLIIFGMGLLFLIYSTSGTLVETLVVIGFVFSGILFNKLYSKSIRINTDIYGATNLLMLTTKRIQKVITLSIIIVTSVIVVIILPSIILFPDKIIPLLTFENSIVANGLGKIGGYYSGTSQFEKAIVYDKELLKIAKGRNNPKETKAILVKVGLLYYSLGEYDKAVSYYEQATMFPLKGDMDETLTIMVSWGDGDNIFRIEQIADYKTPVKQIEKNDIKRRFRLENFFQLYTKLQNLFESDKNLPLSIKREPRLVISLYMGDMSNQIFVKWIEMQNGQVWFEDVYKYNSDEMLRPVHMNTAFAKNSKGVSRNGYLDIPQGLKIRGGLKNLNIKKVHKPVEVEKIEEEMAVLAKGIKSRIKDIAFKIKSRDKE